MTAAFPAMMALLMNNLYLCGRNEKEKRYTGY